jgi:hypothetical protein
MSVCFAHIHVDLAARKGWSSDAARMPRTPQPTNATRS